MESYLYIVNCIIVVAKKQTLPHIRRLYPTISGMENRIRLGLR
jgi:hypothetical protein